MFPFHPDQYAKLKAAKDPAISVKKTASKKKFLSSSFLLCWKSLLTFTAAYILLTSLLSSDTFYYKVDKKNLVHMNFTFAFMEESSNIMRMIT